MTTLKLNMPAPAAKDSQGFVQALKVCIASAAYGVEVDFAVIPGKKTVSLELPRERVTLVEPNSIVRYFAVIGKTPHKTHELELEDSSLIEWEETTLANSIKKGPLNEELLHQAEAKITKSSFGASPSTPPAPAEIILFSSLYSPLTALAPAVIATSPKLKSWFFELALSSPWALNGIEQAAVHTSKPPIPEKHTGPGASIIPDLGAAAKLKKGVTMQLPTPGEKILPKKGERNILITSALPYVNNVPHIGNIVGCVLSADVFSRYCKLRGYNTLYICGTDEYGTATETKALEEKVTPQELCDKYAALHKDIYKWFECGFDMFGRTTTPKQTEIVQEIFQNLLKNDYTVEKTSLQPYCEQHKSFLADRFVEGECPKCHYEDARGDQCDKCGTLLDPFDLIKPRCKVDGATPVARETKHVYLMLDKLQPTIEAWVAKSSKEGDWSKNGRVITESWLKEGLKERGITRDLKWGVPVPLPGYENKVFYVWFDACIGYVSITANYTDEWKQWWKNPEDVKLYQFMGKDNVPFHTVVFPGSEIGTGEAWTMLHHISTTEYLQYEGGKFSKSRNVGVFGNNAQDTGIPPSVWRYYLMAARPETGDTQFEWSAFITKNNSELLANLGNFVNRLIKLVNAKFDSVVPDYTVPSQAPEFDAFKKDVDTILASYLEALESVHLRLGLEKMMQLSSRGNQFLQDNKLDNKLLANEPGKAAAVVGLGLNLIYLLSALVWPYMPSTAESMVEQLNAPLRKITDTWGIEKGEGDLLPGHTIGKAAYLFTNIDAKKGEEWRSKYGGGSGVGVAAAAAPSKELSAKAKNKEKQRIEQEKRLQEKGGAAAGADGSKKEKAKEKVVAAKGEVKKLAERVKEAVVPESSSKPAEEDAKTSSGHQRKKSSVSKTVVPESASKPAETDAKASSGHQRKKSSVSKKN